MRRLGVWGLAWLMVGVLANAALAQEGAASMPDAVEDPGPPATIAVLGPEGSSMVVDPDAGVLLILDTSGSMRGKTGGVPRIETAKQALRTIVKRTMVDGANVALRVYVGDGPDPCFTNLVAWPGAADRRALLDLLDEVDISEGSRSPIAGSILMVASDLEGLGTKTVVLITDGDETCGGDPAATIELLQSAGIDFRLHIAALGIRDKSVRKKMRSWARATNGTYVSVKDAEQLVSLLARAMRARFTVRSLDDPEIELTGDIGGAPLEVPPGRYVITVATETSYESEPVELGPGEAHVEQLPA
jgi:hypothetical protein